MQKYQDSLLIQLPNGDLTKGSGTITVYKAGTNDLATIYSDNGSTQKPNPFSVEPNGEYFFYAADGSYELYIEGPGIIARRTASFKLFDADAKIKAFFPNINDPVELSDETLNGGLFTTVGKINLNIHSPGTTLQVFSDNASASSGGLSNGTFYRTATGVVMVKF